MPRGTPGRRFRTGQRGWSLASERMPPNVELGAVARSRCYRRHRCRRRGLFSHCNLSAYLLRGIDWIGGVVSCRVGVPARRRCYLNLSCQVGLDLLEKGELSEEEFSGLVKAEEGFQKVLCTTNFLYVSAASSPRIRPRPLYYEPVSCLCSMLGV